MLTQKFMEIIMLHKMQTEQIRQSLSTYICTELLIKRLLTA